MISHQCWLILTENIENFSASSNVLFLSSQWQISLKTATYSAIVPRPTAARRTAELPKIRKQGLFGFYLGLRCLIVFGKYTCRFDGARLCSMISVFPSEEPIAWNWHDGFCGGVGSAMHRPTRFYSSLPRSSFLEHLQNTPYALSNF